MIWYRFSKHTPLIAVWRINWSDSDILERYLSKAGESQWLPNLKWHQLREEKWFIYELNCPLCGSCVELLNVAVYVTESLQSKTLGEIGVIWEGLKFLWGLSQEEQGTKTQRHKGKLHKDHGKRATYKPRKETSAWN